MQRVGAQVPAGILATVFAQLRATYTLGFHSVAADGEMHRLAVRVRRPGLERASAAGVRRRADRLLSEAGVPTRRET